MTSFNRFGNHTTAHLSAARAHQQQYDATVAVKAVGPAQFGPLEQFRLLFVQQILFKIHGYHSNFCVFASDDQNHVLTKKAFHNLKSLSDNHSPPSSGKSFHQTATSRALTHVRGCNEETDDELTMNSFPFSPDTLLLSLLAVLFFDNMGNILAFSSLSTEVDSEGICIPISSFMAGVNGGCIRGRCRRDLKEGEIITLTPSEVKAAWVEHRKLAEEEGAAVAKAGSLRGANQDVRNLPSWNDYDGLFDGFICARAMYSDECFDEPSSSSSSSSYKKCKIEAEFGVSNYDGAWMYLFDTDKPKDDEFFLQVEDSNPWENEIVILAKTEVKLKDVLKRDKDEKFGPTALTKVKNVEMGGFFFPARYVAGRDFSKPNAFAWIEKVAMMFKPSPVRERGCGGCRKLPAGLPLVDLNVGIFGEITGTLQEGAPVPEASTTPASPSGTTTTTVPP